jgi:hypothetical protein
MASKPQDDRPATEETDLPATDVRRPEYPPARGEVKVIKNERQVDPGETPGSAETGVQRGEMATDAAGNTPGSPESGDR